MVTLELLLPYVSLEIHYDIFMTVVPVFNVLNHGASQEEKKKVFYQILYRISFCIELFPVFLLFSWLLHGPWQNGTANMFLMECVWCSVLSAHGVPEHSTVLLLALRKKITLSVCSKFSWTLAF